jgi:hypothetical protein
MVAVVYSEVSSGPVCEHGDSLISVCFPAAMLRSVWLRTAVTNLPWRIRCLRVRKIHRAIMVCFYSFLSPLVLERRRKPSESGPYALVLYRLFHGAIHARLQ